jgi:predicted hydrocarbon binding protein
MIYKDKMKEKEIDDETKELLYKHTFDLLNTVYNGDAEAIFYSQISKLVEYEIPQWQIVVKEARRNELKNIAGFNKSTFEKLLPNEEAEFERYIVYTKLELLAEGEHKEEEVEVQWVYEDSAYKLYSLTIPTDFTTPWWLPEPVYRVFK